MPLHYLNIERQIISFIKITVSHLSYNGLLAVFIAFSGIKTIIKYNKVSIMNMEWLTVNKIFLNSILIQNGL